MLTAALVVVELGLDAFDDRGAASSSLYEHGFWARSRFALAGFDLVKLLHLRKHPLRVFGFGFGLKNLRLMCAMQAASEIFPGAPSV